jgi:hypothetical protein
MVKIEHESKNRTMEHLIHVGVFFSVKVDDVMQTEITIVHQHEALVLINIFCYNRGKFDGLQRVRK